MGGAQPEILAAASRTASRKAEASLLLRPEVLVGAERVASVPTRRSGRGAAWQPR